jgi:hypothetical protein
MGIIQGNALTNFLSMGAVAGMPGQAGGLKDLKKLGGLEKFRVAMRKQRIGGSEGNGELLLRTRLDS